MIVISDGDVIKNDVVRNAPQELGFDRWTGKTYGNKEFLLNAVNYLLDDDGLINIRSKANCRCLFGSTKNSQSKNHVATRKYIATTSLTPSFWFCIQLHPKEKIHTLNVNKFVSYISLYAIYL